MARSVRSMGLAVLVAIVVAGFGPPAAAAESDPTHVVAGLEGVTIDGFLSASYSYNANRPDTRTNQVRVFDFDDNSMKLDVFELVLQRGVSKPRDSGFRVDLALGSSVPRVSSSRGLFRTDSTTEDIDLQQAFLSVVAPLGSGLRIDVGKFITIHGYEVIEGYDGWNDHATRSILFGFAIPFTHTGARATYAFSARATGTIMIVNGWDVAVDNNRSKTVGGQLLLTPVTPLTVALNGMIGAERDNTEGDRRTLLDATAVWKVTDRVTFGANGDWGREEGALPSGEDARWDGGAGYARAVFGSAALSLRAEVFQDRDGARTGAVQRLTEVTLTPEVRCTPHLLVRADLRMDHSDHDVFEKRGGVTDAQRTVLVDLIYAF